jgi:RNA polymerase sigma factor (TIGR02999 family)
MHTQADDAAAILLRDWRDGDRAALDRLMPLVRRELRQIAQRYLKREPKSRDIHPSSLVQEAFLRLLSTPHAGWRNQAHFFAVASKVMRHVLVDHARERWRVKRGVSAVHISLEAVEILSPEQVEQIVAIDLALERLAEVDKRKSLVVQMRFFGGLNVEETATALGVAPNTVIRDWNFARAWLRRELSGAGGSGCGTLAAD